jgi:hypothetical protein
MKWLRSNIRHGSRLALFALAVQFVLALGHFHALAGPVAQRAKLCLMKSQWFSRGHHG